MNTEEWMDSAKTYVMSLPTMSGCEDIKVTRTHFAQYQQHMVHNTVITFHLITSIN